MLNKNTGELEIARAISSRVLGAAVAAALLGFISGCDNGPSPTVNLSQQIRQLDQENAEFRQQLDQSHAENERLKGQIQVLSQLQGDGRTEILNRLHKVEIGRHTGFYDKDSDGVKEKLIVYVQPQDNLGDAIKAVGAVNVQLWNLSTDDSAPASAEQSAEDPLLAEWRIDWPQLNELWLASLMGINYRLTLDPPNIPEDLTQPLTVKIEFTDYLSGKTFTDQTTIDPPTQ